MEVLRGRAAFVLNWWRWVAVGDHVACRPKTFPLCYFTRKSSNTWYMQMPGICLYPSFTPSFLFFVFLLLLRETFFTGLYWEHNWLGAVDQPLDARVFGYSCLSLEDTQYCVFSFLTWTTQTSSDFLITSCCQYSRRIWVNTSSLAPPANRSIC